jgi:hypothetical protein
VGVCSFGKALDVGSCKGQMDAVDAGGQCGTVQQAVLGPGLQMRVVNAESVALWLTQLTSVGGGWASGPFQDTSTHGTKGIEQLQHMA